MAACESIESQFQIEEALKSEMSIDQSYNGI